MTFAKGPLFIRAAALGLTYWFVAMLAFELVSPTYNIALFWPANAIAIAAFIFSRRKDWPLYLIALAAAFFSARASGGSISLPTYSGFFAANLIEILIVAETAKRLVLAPITYENLSRVLPVVVLVSIPATIISALIGGTLATFGIEEASLLNASVAWFTSNLTGLLLVLPAVLAWFAPDRPPLQSYTISKIIESTAIAIIFGTICILTAVHMANINHIAHVFPYLMFPVLILAAMRLGIRSTTLATLAVGLFAIALTYLGNGPLNIISLSGLGQIVQMKIGIITITMATVLFASLTTERKWAMESEKLSQARMEEILALAPEAVITASSDMKIQVFNQGAERIFGYTTKEMLGQPLEILMPKDFRNDHHNHINEFDRSGDAYRPMDRRQDVLGLRKDGSVFPAAGSISKLTTGGKKLYTIMLHDITESKRAEAAQLKHSASLNLLHKIAVTANEARTTHQALQVCLDEVCAFTGWPIGHVYLLDKINNQLKTTRVWYLSNEKQFDYFRHLTEQTNFSIGEGLPGRVWESRRPEWIEDVTQDSNFIRNRSNRDIGVKAGFASPVMIGKVVVAVLEFYCEEVVAPDTELLEVMDQVGTQLGRIVERVQAAEALQLAAEEATTANRSKSEFLAAMSHDLRTPLNAIIGFAEIINQQHFGPVSEKYQEYSKDIQLSGELLLSLVNDILDLSAIESGKHSLSKENMSISDVVNECEIIIKDKAQSQGIDLVVNISEDLPVLYADKRAVLQILLNLLSNSIKFTPEGGTITLTFSATGPHHIIEVSDTGKGIPADKIATIAEPFVKGETDPYKAYESTGLGLAIVNSLTNLHSGELDIKSTIGKGTTVTVKLPTRASQPGLISL